MSYSRVWLEKLNPFFTINADVEICQYFLITTNNHSSELTARIYRTTREIKTFIIQRILSNIIILSPFKFHRKVFISNMTNCFLSGLMRSAIIPPNDSQLWNAQARKKTNYLFRKTKIPLVLTIQCCVLKDEEMNLNKHEHCQFWVRILYKRASTGMKQNDKEIPYLICSNTLLRGKLWDFLNRI